MSPPRMVVCGTKFGRVYLAGLAADGAENAGVELAGVLARGSERSRACAERYGVPLYTSPDELPDDVTLACVVVGSAINGGPGAQLAQQLMQRGINVLQEHPLGHDELVACLRTARRNNVVYRINTHYVHLEPVRRFIDAAHLLLARQEPVFIDGQCAFQVAYTLFDILGRVVGSVRPAGFGEVPPFPSGLAAKAVIEPAYRSVDGLFAGIPITLRLQNEMPLIDPDNHAHLFHRLTVGAEGGHLTLVNTHGPVLWSPRPHMSEDMRNLVRFDESAAGHLDLPSAEPIGPAEGPDYRTILREVWPAGAAHAVGELARAVEAGEDPTAEGQYHLALTRLTAEFTGRFGQVRLLHRPEPKILDGAELGARR